MNGDGFADVLLRGDESRPTGVYLGGLDGTHRRADFQIAPTLDGLTARVSSVGDVNGDGFADLLVTAGVDGRITRAVLLPGAARPASARAVVLEADAPWPRSLVGVGDLDGDGFSDLLGLDPPRGGERGSVRVWYGAPRGVHPTPRMLLQAAPDSGIGYAVAGFGDLNGDALPDLLLGAPTHGDGQGRAVAWFNGRCADGALLELGRMQELGGRLGESVALAADADGDGFVEALAAAPFSTADQDRSRVQVFPGAAEPMSAAAEATLAFPGAQIEDIRLIPGGDFNGDGYTDLVVWMHNEQRGPSMRVFPGSPAGFAGATPRVIYPQDFGATETALSASLAGDTDRDGFDDLLVRLAPGQAFIARGSPTGLRTTLPPLLELP
ncbi:MAG: FG-GAP-like repeat-containing protein [Polyangiales bacterium]